MWFEKFGCQCLSSKQKMAIVKQGMSDWPGNDEKMTSQSNVKLRSSERALDLIRGFCFNLV